jgi:hypothetical protein
MGVQSWKNEECIRHFFPICVTSIVQKLSHTLNQWFFQNLIWNIWPKVSNCDRSFIWYAHISHSIQLNIWERFLLFSLWILHFLRADLHSISLLPTPYFQCKMWMALVCKSMTCFRRNGFALFYILKNIKVFILLFDKFYKDSELGVNGI